MFFGVLILILVIVGLVFTANGGGGIGDWLGDKLWPVDPSQKGWDCYNCHHHNPGTHPVGTQQQCVHCKLFNHF